MRASSLGGTAVSDRWVVVLALSAAAGALAARPFPLALAFVTLVVALGARRPVLLCVGACLLTSTMGARAWAGVAPPAPGPVDSATVTLVTDPDDAFGALRAELRYAGRLYEGEARGQPATQLRPRLAGERLVVTGRIAPFPEDLRRRLGRRHLVGRMTIERIDGWHPGNVLTRTANGLRRTLVHGARSLPHDRRALLTGLVLGDDRDQSPAQADQFKAAGLTHLLAVSGQNVAFVLAAAWPVLRLLGLRARWLAALAVLVLFGVITRWEPSVLRAVVMAAVALTAFTTGRPASAVRVLALAVAALLVVDPLLVGSVGFLLSVGACAGIILLAVPLSRRLPGPRPVAAALSVTIAAQVGVAPVLLPVFGTIPAASLPANLLAVPAAAPVTIWGMTAGVLAGVVGDDGARMLHVPTGVLVGWIAGVARWAAGLPLAQLDIAHAVALAAAAAVPLHVRALRVPAAVAATAILLGPAWVGHAPLDGVEVGGGPHLWRAAGATVLVADAAAPPTRVLQDLRSFGVGRLDAVVLERGSGPARALDDVLARYPPRAVLSAPGTRANVGPFVVTVGTEGRATVTRP